MHPIQIARIPITFSISLEDNVSNYPNITLSKYDVIQTLSKTRNANTVQANDLPARISYEISGIKHIEGFRFKTHKIHFK